VEGESHTVPDGYGTVGFERNFGTLAKSQRLIDCLLFCCHFILEVYIKAYTRAVSTVFFRIV
jgi:hypothetical protein